MFRGFVVMKFVKFYEKLPKLIKIGTTEDTECDKT